MFSPISCSYCRRRKVRCSKEESGCRACLKKDIKCEYPSKFRSIELIRLKNQQGSQASTSAASAAVALVSTNQEKSLLAKGTPIIASILSPTAISSTGSSSMLQRIPSNLSMATSASEQTNDIKTNINHYKNKIAELESKMNSTRDPLSMFESCNQQHNQYNIASSECGITGTSPSPLGQRSQVNTTFTTEKKRFPLLVENDETANVKMIRKLVDMFFNADEFSYFSDIYNKDDVVSFIDSYASISHWNHDELMITLIAILIDVIKNFLNKTKEEPVLQSQTSVLRLLISEYAQIVNNQPFHTVTILKSQIIMINYYFYVMDFEKSWNLLFQVVANAYSLGLHITQGPVWIKLNLLESISASTTSKPNCISGILLKKQDVVDSSDEFQELKFAELLREKNLKFIGSYIHKEELSYDIDVFQVGLRFDTYAKFLNDKIDAILSDRAISKALKNQKLQKAYFLLAMNCSSSMKLHFEFFETQDFSDDKTVQLLGDFLAILEASTFSKLHNLRDKFAFLECLVFQFMLIFLRMLNHKAVLCVLKPSSHPLGIVTDKGHKEDKLLSQLKIFKEYQRRLDLIFARNPLYTNARALKAYDIISNVNLDQINPGHQLIPSRINKENTSYTAMGYSASESMSSNRPSSSLHDLLNPDPNHYHSSSFPTPSISTLHTPTVSIAPEKTLTGNIFEDAGLLYFVTDDIKSLLDDRNILAALTDITSIRTLANERGDEYNHYIIT